MAFIRHRGKTKLMYFKKTDTSVASSLRDGSLVSFSDSANIHYARGDSTDRILGVSRLRVTATDTSSWAGAPFVPVEVPVEMGVEWLIDVDTDAGASDTDIGRYCRIDTAGTNSAGIDSEGVRVDMNDTITRDVLVTGIVSATKIIGVIARSVFAAPRTLDTVDTGP